MALTFTELQELKLLMETDRDEFRGYIDQKISQADVASIPGQSASSIAGSRTVGVFLGVSPDLPGSISVGGEGQVMLAYDTQTQETGIYFYTGLTAGASLPLPGLPTLPVSGVFLFSGKLDDLKGLSGGLQGSAGAAVGWSATTSGHVMVQVGQEVDMNIELTGGFTWELQKEQPVIDWDLVEARIEEMFADTPWKITQIKTDIYKHKKMYNNLLNGEFLEKYDFLSAVDESCFLAGTKIDLWPQEANLQLGPDGTYDEAALHDIIERKPIQDIAVGDIVVSFTGDGDLVPARVSRTFRNTAKIVLDFFGTSVTPGHVFYRHDGTRASNYETLIDILCDDGVIRTSNGDLIRASTGVQLGDDQDRIVQAVTGTAREAGVRVTERGQLRLGSRFITDDGQDLCVNDLLLACGAVLTDGGLLQIDGQAPMPLHWSLSDRLPRPESYVLARSGSSLEDIFRAAEWDGQRPWMQAPLAPESGPIAPYSAGERDSMIPNVPLRESEPDYRPDNQTHLALSIQNASK